MSKITFVTRFWVSFLTLLIPQFSFSYYPEGEDGWNFSASLLYWHAHEQGLGYTNKPADVLTTDDFTKNSIINPSFKSEWGFRLGTDYTMCNLSWTFQAYWTYLKSRADGKKSFNSGAPEFLGIYPVWSMGPDTLESDYVSSASSKWHLRTNIIDLNAQYNCPCLWYKLDLNPFLGLRGVSLNQKFRAKYKGGTFFSGEDVNTLQSRCYGIGPRFGINVDYYLDCGFSIFGRAAVAPLYARFHIKQHETYLERTRFHRSFTNDNFVLSTDYEIGLRWKGKPTYCLPCIVLDIAWEGQEFFFANRFHRGRFHFFAKDRSLFLQGLTLSAALDF